MEWTLLFIVLWFVADRIEKAEEREFNAEWDRQGRNIDDKTY